MSELLEYIITLLKVYCYVRVTERKLWSYFFAGEYIIGRLIGFWESSDSYKWQRPRDEDGNMTEWVRVSKAEENGLVKYSLSYNG